MATKEEILSEMLESVPNTYDKRTGNFIHSAIYPVAEQLEKTDESIEQAVDKMNISNLSGDELEKRVLERTGIIRKEATKALGEVTLTGTGTVNIGDLFETEDGIQFEATETKSIISSGTVNIEAVIPGDSGNVPSNTINLFPVTLAGFTAVTNTNPTEDGFEAESDADLLGRYFDRTQTPSTSANKNQFRNWSKEVAGIGDAKVIPLWFGDNTVKIVIINSARLPTSTQLVTDVQEYIDPNSSGTGEGVAPVGAYVTVESATGVNVDVSATIVLSTGYTQQQAIDNFTDDLIEHLASIAFVESIVSYAKIGKILIDAEGVEDYTDLLVNGGTTNPNILPEEVAVIGSVTLNV